MKKTIVIATIHPWNIEQFRRWKVLRGFRAVLINKKEDLTHARLLKLNPRFIFFPHWSWIIPPEIYTNFECVVFHMTDLPFGRGGSPLQNLLVRGVYKTKLSALRVGGGLDTGPIYVKRPLDLSRGSAEELYRKAAQMVFPMITEILMKNLKPKAQKGKVVSFRRRKPEESRIPTGLSPRKLYDFIRMLDAPEYPRAFVEIGDWRMEFSDAELRGETVHACVFLRKKTDGKKS